LRRVKLRLSSDRLSELHPADIAEIMEELSPDERQSIVEAMDDETAAEAIAELDERLQTQVMEKLDPEKAAHIIEEMNPDEAADLMQNMEPETSREVLEEMETQEASDVEVLLNFGPDTAGGMMNTEIVVVGEDATRGEVVDHIRFHEISTEQLDNIVLINREAKLAGTVPIARLVLAAREDRMGDLTFEPLLSVAPDTKQKEIFEIFDKYNLRSLVVVNGENCPIGAIAVDDVVSHMREKL
jgi:Mg/Co/Ni transporter MgtE